MTDKLLASADADAVDTLLRDLRVSSTVFCRSRLGAPWGFGVQGHGRAVFHVITGGACWLEVEGEPDRYRLEAGDLAILTRGQTHWLRDQKTSPALWLEDILTEDRMEPDLRLRSGGGGEVTDMLCGAFAIEGTVHHPLLSSLPSVICIRGSAQRPLPWLEATLALVADEIHTPGNGGAALLERVSEILLGQALRASLLDLQHADTTSLFYDEDIAPAVRAIHERPEQSWTVGELARLCAMSRSSFAERFRALTGDSPIRYVTRCRLARAAAQLRTTDAPLAEVARLAGYESPFSFSRAFKRVFAVAPRTYRAQRVEHGTRAQAS